MIDVSIISSGHHVADARIHRLADALVRSGFNVEVIARGESFQAPASVRFRAAPGGRKLWARGLRALFLPFLARGQVIIAIDPDLCLGLLIACGAKRRIAVCDVHEDYLALLRDRAWATGLVGVIARKVARDATKIAAKAVLTIVADDHVPPLLAKNRIVVRNLPDTTLISPTALLDDEPRAVYVGDVRKSRGLHVMLNAIEMAPHWKLDIIGPVSGIDQPFVDEWVASNPARDRVRFYGRLAPAHTWKVVSGAWVGLAILDATPAFMETVPSKIYEYCAARLAVISSPLPRVVEMVNRSKNGVMATTPGEIAAALEWWSSHRAELESTRMRGAQLVESGDPYAPFAVRIGSLLTPPR